MINMKLHITFFDCGENAKSHILLQPPHHIAKYLEPSKNAQYYPPLQMVICDEYTKQNNKIQLATRAVINETPNENY